MRLAVKTRHLCGVTGSSGDLRELCGSDAVVMGVARPRDGLPKRCYSKGSHERQLVAVRRMFSPAGGVGEGLHESLPGTEVSAFTSCRGVGARCSLEERRTVFQAAD